ncbi:MAG: DUF1343 domain-containing protein [Chitinivibrionia bacterium]|nr:DUF1343 domain-containing protein [Chitinivibrionia bacterium]
MVITGLAQLSANIDKYIGKKNIAILCHAASVDAKLNHIIDILQKKGANIKAIFGPQHGLFGQTQDNMIEWEATVAPRDEKSAKNTASVYSLYGQTRTPSDEMLSGVDCLIVDLQDVGARPYTYIWTMKECAGVCEKLGIEMLVLDRPNPIGFFEEEGAVLQPKYFSFVGGAQIKMAHKKTIGQIAKMFKNEFFPNLNLNVVEMQNYDINMKFEETGLPWVIPSPNMPTVDTAIVYPGQVLLETTNVSEGRGTCKPFEFFGAPYIKPAEFLQTFNSFNIDGCILRRHDFSPTFNKYSGADNRVCGKTDDKTLQKHDCVGFQIHITDLAKFKPVKTSVAILKSIALTSPDDFLLNPPPYEYEYVNMPLDIVWGDSSLREYLADSSARDF